MALFNFGRRNINEETVNESINNNALQLRESSLDLIAFGTRGSEYYIRENEHDDAKDLPGVLRFSPETTKHLVKLKSIIENPHKFQITTGNNENKIQQGDVLLNIGSAVNSYRFLEPEALTRLNSISDEIAIQTKGEQIREKTNIHLTFCKSGKCNGIWLLSYDYYSPFNTAHSMGMYSKLPTRRPLMQFIFSPAKLSQHENFIDVKNSENYPDILGLSTFTKKFIMYAGSNSIDGFSNLNFIFDGKACAKEEEKQNYKDESEKRAYLYQLNNLDNAEFSIVELGKIKLNGRTYYIYSGAELRQAREDVKVSLRRASLIRDI